MKWFMLMVIVLLAVQFIACEDEEKIEEMERQKANLTEEVSTLEEELVIVSGRLEQLKQYPEVQTSGGESIPTAVSEPTEQLRVIVDALNMRDKPNTTTSEKIGLLSKGDIVEVLEKQNSWALVRTKSGIEDWACIKLDGEVFLVAAE